MAPDESESNESRPPPGPPIGAPGDHIPRWLATVVLIALLGASIASVWLILTLPPPSERGQGRAPAATENAEAERSRD